AEKLKADWAIDQLTSPPPATPPGTPPGHPAKAGNLKGSVDGDGNFTAENGQPQGGAIVATVDTGGKKSSGFARVRVMPKMPWSFDFEKSVANKPPLTWLNAGGKFKVIELPDKNKVLVKTLDMDLYHAART